VWASEDEAVDGARNKLERDTLSKGQKKELAVCLDHWKLMLSDEPGRTWLAEHVIDTGDAPPIRSISYQISIKWRELVKRELDQLVNQGILCPSTSPWSSQVVCNPKKDGNIPICSDSKVVFPYKTRNTIWPVLRV